MLQVKSQILDFLLLMLRILLDFNLDASYKDSRFSEILLEKSFKFVLNRGDGIVTFNLSLMLLPAEINPIPEK